MFFTEMAAPGITAPVASTTVPSKVPRKVCASRDVVNAAKRTTNNRRRGVARMTVTSLRKSSVNRETLYTINIMDG
jgi:hypothetical protein